MSGFAMHDLETESRQLATRWLARFAPLVNNSPTWDQDRLKESIRILHDLKAESSDLIGRLDHLWKSEDVELTQTVRTAVLQLDSIENELRSHLGFVSPGDPLSSVNLDDLQERLARRQAKQEIGLSTTEPIPFVLEEKSSPSNPAAGLAIGIFGLGWTAFTTVHCILMISGMKKALGWAALGLLAFYSIFFFVGFAMLAAAVYAFATETIRLEGRKLTITRSLLGISREKSVTLDRDAVARVGVREMAMQQKGAPTLAINLSTDDGKTVSIGGYASEEARKRLAVKINQYLSIRG